MYMTMDNCIQLAVYQTPSPIPPFPLYLDTLLQCARLLNCDCIDNSMSVPAPRPSSPEVVLHRLVVV
jgi:hypothetical protein